MEALTAAGLEIRSYLLRYAKKNGIMVKEHVSEGLSGSRTAFYCHIQARGSDPVKSATAVSLESRDNALIMAFLNFGCADIDFLPENV